MPPALTTIASIRTLTTLKSLHDAIRHAAANRTAFGAGERVWLCDLARELCTPLHELAAALINANRRGMIRLSRCDLTHLAPHGVVEASEIGDRVSTWHLVRVPE
jgi:hypothetical protein